MSRGKALLADQGHEAAAFQALHGDVVLLLAHNFQDLLLRIADRDHQSSTGG